MIIDYFNFALKNLRKRKLRAWLTIIGVIISVATIFFLVSISVGLREAVNEQFRVLGTDKFFIQPKGTLGGPGTGSVVTLTTEDVEAAGKVSGVKRATYYSVGNGKVEFSEQTRYFPIIGIPLEDKETFRVIAESISWKIDEGRLLQKGDEGKVMIGSQYKYNNVFKKPAKTGDRLLVNGKEYRIVGILKSVGNPYDDQNIFISYNDFKEQFNSEKGVDFILVQVEAGEDTKKIAEKVESRLIKFRGLTEKTRDFDIFTPEEILESLGGVLNIITVFLISIAAISLIVGGIGIANTMYTSVLERTREIGTMKAVGARNSDIFLIFLIESGFIGLIGGVIGIILGVVLSKTVEFMAVNYLATTLLKPAFPAYLIAGSLLFGFLTGGFSGLLPARQASKLKPIDALRYE